MKIVFMGTPDFAVPSLEALIDKFGVEAVFTQPDRPRGRGKKMVFSPVKEIAVKHDIKVFQPEKLKDDIEAVEYLKELKPDFIIVVAFGQILTKEVLDIPSRSWPTRWALPVRQRTPSLPPWSATTSCTISRTTRTSASPLTV